MQRLARLALHVSSSGLKSHRQYHHASQAQVVEQRSVKPRVLGSSPRRSATFVLWTNWGFALDRRKPRTACGSRNVGSQAKRHLRDVERQVALLGLINPVCQGQYLGRLPLRRGAQGEPVGLQTPLSRGSTPPLVSPNRIVGAERRPSRALNSASRVRVPGPPSLCPSSSCWK